MGDFLKSYYDNRVDYVTVMPFPGEYLKLAGDNWSEEADELATILRVAFPKDPE